MQIPKFIEIKTAAGTRAAFLSPKADSLKSCYPDCRLNGESTLEFLLPTNSKKIDKLTPECTIWAGGRVYNLLKDDASDIVRDDNNKRWAKFMAVERWNELDTEYPEPYITNDPLTPTPADLAVIIVGGGSDLSGGLYTVGTAAHAMYAVLDGSGWTIGMVDVTGTHDLEMEKVSRLACIKEIQNIWGGYLVWDSVNKTVSLRDANTWQNYTGFQIRYKKNEKTLTRTQSNRLVTKLYAFGKDDLDIASVNGGLKYIENHSYTANTYTAPYRNPDIEDAQELMDAATAELSLVCHPKYLYRGKIADLRTLPEYSHEDFTVGDMADVIDPDVSPDSPRPRIIRHKYNLFQPWDCELELGDPEERLVEQLKASFGTSGYIDNTLTSSGQLSGYKLVDGSIPDVKIINLTADKITAGTIDASVITVTNLVVGTNVTMGPNATISWDKVTDQPSIPSQYTDAEAVEAIENTYIDAYNVWTVNVYSQNITGGNFTALNRIKLGDNSVNVNRLLRLATYGGADAVIKAWTDIGPGLTIGYLNSTDPDTASLTDLDFVNIFATYLRLNGEMVATQNWVNSLGATYKFG